MLSLTKQPSVAQVDSCTLPYRLGQPVYMKELLQHFDKVLTPVSGPRQLGRQSLEYSMTDVAAARRK